MAPSSQSCAKACGQLIKCNACGTKETFGGSRDSFCTVKGESVDQTRQPGTLSHSTYNTWTHWEGRIRNPSSLWMLQEGVGSGSTIKHFLCYLDVTSSLPLCSLHSCCLSSFGLRPALACWTAPRSLWQMGNLTLPALALVSTG